MMMPSGEPMIRRLRHASFAALCAATLVVACGKADKPADSSKVADSAVAARTASAPAASAPPMSDANIFAALDEANMADSATGAMAATKATSAEVRSYGKEMMRDHHALRAEGQALAKKLNITPEPAPNDSSPAKDKAVADSLTSLAGGPAWDRFYVDHAVTHHEMVLATAQNAMSATQNADIKAMLTRAAPIIQNHLDRAKALQAKLK
jgi:putative membrane protein